MALVSGRPISFQMDLYTPLYVPRPWLISSTIASLRPVAYSGGLGLAGAGLAGIGGLGGIGGFAGGQGMAPPPPLAAAARRTDDGKGRVLEEADTVEELKKLDDGWT